MFHRSQAATRLDKARKSPLGAWPEALAQGEELPEALREAREVALQGGQLQVQTRLRRATRLAPGDLSLRHLQEALQTGSEARVRWAVMGTRGAEPGEGAGT